MFDVLIIGAGPAGLTAAIYTARNNLKVGIIEHNVPGGQMVNTAFIENYPGFKTINGADLSMSMYEQVVALEVPFFWFSVQEVKKENDYFLVIGDETLKAKTVIVATGTVHKTLGVKGEAELSGRGISWCAICDGAFYKNQDVAVIGGGNSAFEESIFLSSLVKNVYLIHHREGFRADETLVSKVKEVPNIKMMLNQKVTEFIGKGKLEALRLWNVKTNEESLLPVAGCFEFIGFNPSTGFLKDLAVVEASGYLAVDKHCATTVKGLFAAGDVVQKDIRQITTAVNDGAIAALSANKYLK
ncbi:MAG TPA: thioredoxin-disulfide reductase [Bacilli bacterium]|nr:MAG: Thioredoxin reductase [Tenericutes bacterium ADurb.BinA124]HNZ50450.1 thioredoxin-disulfide reductase [Bacilli bacterium]HPX84411.1 thioredoxin-disulfide reductase [Bacilli bacterium]HQC74468.1 thioredoxin-disulfide reductase [Bacilli bacterium]